MLITEGIELIKPAPLPQRPTDWIDLGCGAGFFTNVLAQLLFTGSTITGIDKKPQLPEFNSSAAITIYFKQADFINDTLHFKNLDGILMANALHFVQYKDVLLQKISAYIKSGASLLLIEYDTLKANPWVPYPINYITLKNLLVKNNFTDVQKIGERNAAYNSGRMYAASAIKK